MLNGETVRGSMLLLVHDAPRRYSEFVRELGRPDKTVFENLRTLQQTGLVAKTGDKYTITKTGTSSDELWVDIAKARREDE